MKRRYRTCLITDRLNELAPATDGPGAAKVIADLVSRRRSEAEPGCADEGLSDELEEFVGFVAKIFRGSIHLYPGSPGHDRVNDLAIAACRQSKMAIWAIPGRHSSASYVGTIPGQDIPQGWIPAGVTFVSLCRSGAKVDE